MELTGAVAGTGATTTAADTDGFPPFDADAPRPASLADCHDTADRLAYLCGQVRGSVTRTRDAEGNVWLRLKTADGDVLSAKQPTTAACVAELLTRAGVLA